MLCMNGYENDYVRYCEKNISQLVTHYQELIGVLKTRPIDFENGLCAHLVLALDNYFLHRSRAIEGKDGNPLNEVRLICAAITENKGIFTQNKTMKYDANNSVLKFNYGDEVRITIEEFSKLNEGFIEQIKIKFCEAK